MRLQRTIAAPAIVASALAAMAAPALAQETIIEGPGYEIGEGTVLHPSAGLETGIISNVFYEDANGRTAPVSRLRVSFSLASQDNQTEGEREMAAKLENAAPGISDEDASEELDPELRDAADPDPGLDFRLSGYLAREQYLHADGDVMQQSNFYGGLEAHVTAMPRGMTSFYLDDKLMRVTGPVNFESSRSLNRDINHLTVGARYRPGMGALQFRLQYENTIDRFESSESAFANRLHHLARGIAEWQFLPVTRFFFDASFGYFGPLSDGQPQLLKRSSTPLRVRLGGASAITQLTTLRSHIGFGKGFYEAGEDFTGILFGTELGWRYSPVGRFTVAYEYDFADSTQANFYRDHAFVAKIDHQVAVVLLNAGLDVRLRGYRGISELIGPMGNTSRDDLILRAFAKGYYLYRDWLGFTAEIDAISDRTDFVANVVNSDGTPVMDPVTGATVTDDPSYQRLLVLLGAVAAF